MKKNDKVILADEGEVLDVEIEEDLLAANRSLAESNRKLLKQHGIKSIDIRGSVGAGKTLLIERLVEKLKDKYQISVIAGDVTTTIDADRIQKYGVNTVQINTGKECHLDAMLIKRALKKIDLNKTNLLIIENVGNLICPADFPLGAELNVTVVSVTEGDSMILKHPMIFKDADVIVINKIDLAQIMGSDINKLVNDARKVNPKAKVVLTSAKTSEGLSDFITALGL
ncbi:MAG: hydrogenase nickel incorporation protein HypB [Candidatus Odinarchaeum yellowstonii]|uniref:Hydrogenase nickel incorporation protein HypB n=1 Tax=Odinarchaeota yellowstonii (strain LCB_4) TaxID=1841599 RepID=A0AAF0D2R6_ODILC|nr:MAG: hydrogenase nickel incorporation protein HypB [Candidatus Odinarchaeum yellowstonii]